MNTLKETTLQRALNLAGDLRELKGESEVIEIMTTGFRSKLAEVANYSVNLVNELLAIYEEIPEFKQFIQNQRGGDIDKSEFLKMIKEIRETVRK